MTPRVTELRRIGALLRRSIARRAMSAVPFLVLAALLIGTDVTWCPVAGVFGIPCPSCGLTRATLALFFGDWSRANALHPGVWPVLAFLAAVASVTAVSRHRPWANKVLGWIGAAILALLVVLWLARFWGAWGGPVVVRPWRL
ncbi:MAG: DUF2752 domain-containing protein [Myxococcales bacterium]